MVSNRRRISHWRAVGRRFYGRDRWSIDHWRATSCRFKRCSLRKIVLWNGIV